MGKFFCKYRELLLAPLAVLAILFGVYAIKGVYPFGELTIGYYDMNVSFVPIYTHLVDAIHGDVSVFYDWFAGCGMGDISTLGYFVFSPFNLFFFFVRRDCVAESMSFFLALKVMIMALTMNLYIRKKYPGLSAFYKVTAGVIYALGGYVIQYYTNIFFLDSLAIFPLVMIGLDNMLKRNKPYGYLFWLSLSYLINIYFGYMISLYIIVHTMAYLLFECEKRDIKRTVATLGIYTLLALAISAVLVMPMAVKTLMSTRIEMSKKMGYFDIISTAFCSFWGNKMVMFFGTELGIVSIAYMFICTRVTGKDKKLFYSYLFRLVFLMIPFMYEGTNLLWHTGTYIHFPMRFAFILTFFAIDAFACFVTRFGELPRSNAPLFSKKSVKITGYVIVAAIISLCFFITYRFAKPFLIGGIHNTEAYLNLALPFIAISFTAAISVMLLRENMFKRIVVMLFVAAQTTIMCYGFIAPMDYQEYILCDKYALKRVVQLRENVGIENDNLSRVKNTDGILFPNYGLVLGVPSLSHWLNDATYDFCVSTKSIGYHQEDRIVGDAGGTAFSDALLNVKYTLSFNEKNPELYKLRKKADDIYVCDANYTLPFGIPVSENLNKVEFAQTAVENQNLLYKALTDIDENIMENCLKNKYKSDVKPYEDEGSISLVTVSREEAKLSEPEFYNTTFKIPVKGQGTLYAIMHSEEEEEEEGSPFSMKYVTMGAENEKKENKTYRFIINGKKPTMIEYRNERVEVFPNLKNMGFFEMGTFKDETITLEIVSKNKDLSNLQIGLLSNDKLKELCDSYEDKGAYDVVAEGRRLSFKTKGDDERYIFIPVEYDKNWSAKVNGEKAQVVPSIGNAFMTVKVPAGESSVEMTYFPRELSLGGVISLVGILLAVLVGAMKRKGKDIAENKPVQWICFGAFVLICVGFIVFFNIIPIIAGIIYKIRYAVWLVDLKN